MAWKLQPWIDRVTASELSPGRRAEIVAELETFDQALRAGDEAVMSASVEVVTGLLERHGLRDVTEPVIRAFIESTQSEVRRGHAWCNLGMIRNDAREHAEAEKAFDHAEAIFTEVGDDEGLARVLFGRGCLARDLGDDAGACRYFGDALARTTYRDKRLRIREALIGAEFDTGRHEEAQLACEAWLAEAASDVLSDAARDRLPHVLREYCLIGRRYVLLGDRHKAERVADEARRIAQEYGLDAGQICAELTDALRGDR